MAFRDDFGGTALRADWLQAIKPSDNAAALTVGSSNLVLQSGTNPGQVRYVSLGIGAQRRVIQLNFTMTLSAREPNQTWFVGLFNNQDPRLATQSARWRWSGSSAVTVAFAETTSDAASDGVAVNRAVTTSAAVSAYYIYLDTMLANFRQGGTSFPPTTDIVTNYLHIPASQQNLWVSLGCYNGNPGPAASQTMTVDVVEVSESVMT
jgi:hypothetical protein